MGVNSLKQTCFFIRNYQLKQNHGNSDPLALFMCYIVKNNLPLNGAREPIFELLRNVCIVCNCGKLRSE